MGIDFPLRSVLAYPVFLVVVTHYRYTTNVPTQYFQTVIKASSNLPAGGQSTRIRVSPFARPYD